MTNEVVGFRNADFGFRNVLAQNGSQLTTNEVVGFRNAECGFRNADFGFRNVLAQKGTQLKSKINTQHQLFIAKIRNPESEIRNRK